MERIHWLIFHISISVNFKVGFPSKLGIAVCRDAVPVTEDSLSY
jgi:hypothetical protein